MSNIHLENIRVYEKWCQFANCFLKHNVGTWNTQSVAGKPCSRTGSRHEAARSERGAGGSGRGSRAVHAASAGASARRWTRDALRVMVTVAALTCFSTNCYMETVTSGVRGPVPCRCLLLLLLLVLLLPPPPSLRKAARLSGAVFSVVKA